MFKLIKKNSGARRGQLTLRSGKVQTPFFMPCATFAVGRGISATDYQSVGLQCLISNSFLLSLKPSAQRVNKLGGLHKFMGFSGGIFTDSGGFQSSSSKMYVRTTKNAVHLKSPYDGKTHILTPKKVMETQQLIRSDVAMVIDDMAPPDVTVDQYQKALQNTYNWAKLCKELHTDKKQLLFAIVQGGYDAKLREECAKKLIELDFDGYGIGGCAIGEPKPDMYVAIKNSTPHLPENKPRYLMGVGSPPDIVEAVGLGVDCFDSIYPTMNARHNNLFTFKGNLVIDKLDFAEDLRPIEKDCDCWVCKKHSRAYIRHLSTVNEAEGKRMRQVHNLRFMMRLMSKIREAIENNRYEEFRVDFLNKWFRGKVPLWHQ